MAMTLFLNDGRRELVLNNEREVLGRLIEEVLGLDAWRLFDELLNRKEELDGWEKAANILQGFRGRALRYVEEALALLDVPTPDLGLLRDVPEDIRNELGDEE